ncbi:hypothetical protein BC943DRAFT_364297 [Umbelopsis sp. AD052]|nr:hypothetical protein BC943DRAFT_364297 [Umbelopsis sp. AD052]
MHFSSSIHFTGFPSYYTSAAAAMSERRVKTGSAHEYTHNASINNVSSASDALDAMCLLQPFEYLPGLYYPPDNSLAEPVMNMNEPNNVKQQLSYQMLSHIPQSTYTPPEIEAIEQGSSAPLSATPNLNRVSHSSIFINSFEPSLVVPNSKPGTDAFKEKKKSAKERKGEQNEAGSSYQRHVYVLKACKTCKAAHVACDVERPCQRCRRIGKEDSCEDAERKKRGRPSLAKAENRLKAQVIKHNTDHPKCTSSIKDIPIKSPSPAQHPEKWFLSWQLPSANKSAGTDQSRTGPPYRIAPSDNGPTIDDIDIKHEYHANYSTSSQRRSRSLEIYDHHSTYQQPRNPYHQVDTQGAHNVSDAYYRVNGSYRQGYDAERWLCYPEGQSQPYLYYSQPTSPWTPTFPVERNASHSSTHAHFQ